MEIFISISSTVAESKGIDLANVHLSFVFDEATGQKAVNVIDNETGEVIRQIPPDEILDTRTEDEHDDR